MDLKRSYQASWVGHQAAGSISGSFEAKIFGSTSRGIFLKGPSAEILFLSYEVFPGPLTINLDTLPSKGRLESQANQTVPVSPASIQLPSGEEIRLSGADIWRPPPLPVARGGRLVREQTLRELSLLASERNNTGGLAPLLARILNLPGPPVPAWQQPFERAWAALVAGRTGPGLPPTQGQLEAVLGLGSGLTPSGDDFACGLLLALNRLSLSEQPDGVHEFSSSLAQSAALRTTSLSAALIQAAALGSADVRLVSAWDGLLSAALPPAQIFQNLAAYGSTSGIDALAGFAAASFLINE